MRRDRPRVHRPAVAAARGRPRRVQRHAGAATRACSRDKATGGSVELLLERIVADDEAWAQVRASHAPRPGAELALPGGATRARARARRSLLPPRVRRHRAAARLARAAWRSAAAAVHRPRRPRTPTRRATRPSTRACPAPSPRRPPDCISTTRCSTALAARGVERAFVTLHVGAGTFHPVQHDDLARHRMHAEWYSLPPATVDGDRARRGRAAARIVAVGTTTLRALESAARADGGMRAGAAETALFITPGVSASPSSTGSHQFPPAALDAADARQRVRRIRRDPRRVRARDRRPLPLLQLRRRDAARARSGRRPGVTDAKPRHIVGQKRRRSDDNAAQRCHSVQQDPAKPRRRSAVCRLGRRGANALLLRATEFVAEIASLVRSRGNPRFHEDLLDCALLAARVRRRRSPPRLPLAAPVHSRRASACSRTSTPCETAADFNARIPTHTFTPIDTATTIPTLKSLTNAFDVLLVFEDSTYGNAPAVGNAAAAFANTGRAVVIGTFYDQDRSDGPAGEFARTAGARSSRSTPTRPTAPARRTRRARSTPRRWSRTRSRRASRRSPAPSSPGGNTGQAGHHGRRLVEAAQRAGSARPGDRLPHHGRGVRDPGGDRAELSVRSATSAPTSAATSTARGRTRSTSPPTTASRRPASPTTSDPATIPTLSQWGLLLTILLVGAAAVLAAPPVRPVSAPPRGASRRRRPSAPASLHALFRPRDVG